MCGGGYKGMFKIAICDDEIKEVKRIQSIVENFMETYAITHNINAFTSGKELVESKETYELVFLDISMSEMDGLEVGVRLYQKNFKTRIIYITSFNEFLNEAVNHTHAFAYLSKPIKEETLIKQIEELVKMIGMEKENEVEIELKNVIEVGGEGKEYLAIKIPVSSILYYEYVKSNRKIRVKTKNQIYEYAGTMVEVERKMEIYEFGLCFRGLLVNLQHVVKAKGNTVYLNTGEKLPLSQKRVTEFKEQLSEFVHRSIQ